MLKKIIFVILVLVLLSMPSHADENTGAHIIDPCSKKGYSQCVEQRTEECMGEGHDHRYCQEQAEEYCEDECRELQYRKEQYIEDRYKREQYIDNPDPGHMIAETPAENVAEIVLIASLFFSLWYLFGRR